MKSSSSDTKLTHLSFVEKVAIQHKLKEHIIKTKSSPERASLSKTDRSMEHDQPKVQ